MSSVDVVGGVYGEGCTFPHWQQIYGSAGRAAAGLAPHVDTVRLHTVIPTEQSKCITPIFESFGVDVASKPGEQFIGFDYLHCLADPVITPHRTVIRTQETFHVDAKVAILFGMMECAPTVDAEICVYDPQSPVNPQGFRNTGSKAKHLAFTANAGEIKVLTGKGLNEGAQDLLKSEGAEIVLAKCGLDGVLVFDSTGQIGAVPSYKTNNVFTIGSGDVFVAAFALAWGIHGEDPIQAADYASKAAAQYVETSALPIQSFEAAKRTPREPVVLAGGHIYLAGPFRELGQRVIVNEVRKLLGILGMTVFSPVHDIGHGPAENVVKQDLEALNNCDAVLAILNGSSPGTVFEVGYAAAKTKPIFCIAQNMRTNDMKFPIGVGCVIHNDFVSALHLLAWRT